MLRVLTYHRVAPAGRDPALLPSLISATPAEFAEQMRHLARNYRVISAEQVLQCLSHRRRLPQRAVLITFDDAYMDFGEIAWPILRRLRLPATLFVPTAYPSSPAAAFWWDRVYRAITHKPFARVHVRTLGTLPLDTPERRRRSLREIQSHIKALPHELAMRVVEEICEQLKEPRERRPSVLTWEHLRGLSREGVTLGARTQTHPLLTRLPLEQARDEIRGSQEDLLENIGTTLPIFSYPDGAHNDAIVRIVREEGIRLAFTTSAGHNAAAAFYPLRLRRTNITPRTTVPIFRLRLLPLAGYADTWRQKIEQAARPTNRVVVRKVRRTLLPAARAEQPAPPRIAYIMSRFPKLTETFVLYEMRELEKLGVPVEVYPLLREHEEVTHPEAQDFIRRAHYRPFLSPSFLRAHWYFLRRQPTAYRKLLGEVLSGTLGSANFFFGALAIFPKAVQFAYEMRAQRITHAHAHFATHPAIAALMIHRLTGIPFSFTAHGSDLHVDRTMLAGKSAAAKFVVTVSEYNKELIVETCGEETRQKVHVVHCGVNPEKFSGERHEGGNGPLRILCVASFEEVKGHTYLLDACRILRQRMVDFTCELVGDGPMRDAVEAQIARLGLEDVVYLRGARAQDDVVNLLSEGDVAVLASIPTRNGKREGIPVALMEAMASGLPVVASDISGIPELVEHGSTGFLVPPGDVLGLANALHTLARDGELRERMGRAGKKKIEAEFSLAASAAKLAELFAGRAATALRQELVMTAASSAAAGDVIPVVVPRPREQEAPRGVFAD